MGHAIKSHLFNITPYISTFGHPPAWLAGPHSFQGLHPNISKNSLECFHVAIKRIWSSPPAGGWELTYTAQGSKYKNGNSENTASVKSAPPPPASFNSSTADLTAGERRDLSMLESLKHLSTCGRQPLPSIRMCLSSPALCTAV